MESVSRGREEINTRKLEVNSGNSSSTRRKKLIMELKLIHAEKRKERKTLLCYILLNA